jgi:hypothetical protein
VSLTIISYDLSEDLSVILISITGN